MNREKGGSPERDALFDAILMLRDREECRRFFEDVCTINELGEMAKRLHVARLLSEGMSYIQISKETGVSTATISRVNRCITWGEGGYDIALRRMKGEGEEEEA